MRTVLLTVARHTLEKFLSFVRRVDANADDLHVAFQISFPLVDKGRHLGPAPRSPTATIEKNNRGRRRAEDRWKFDRDAVDILKSCRGKLIANR